MYEARCWSVFRDGFLENFTGVRSMFETFLGQLICLYLVELESLGQGIAAYPHIQLFQEYSFEVAGYISAVTSTFLDQNSARNVSTG